MSQMNALSEHPAKVTSRLWAVWAVLSAFGTYFCMYAFRKPFTAAGFDEIAFMGIPLKSLFVTSQILGYTISKFLGIKVISEMPPQNSRWYCSLSCQRHGTLCSCF